MKKQNILDAALEEFGQKDYDRASINAIISKSKTSKGTFYYYFKSKEKLYFELINQIVKDKMEYIQKSTKHINSYKTDSIFDVFKQQIESSIDFGLTYPKYTYFIVRITKESNTEIKEKAMQIIGMSANKYFNQLIKSDIGNKKIRNDIPEEFICSLIMYMLTHFNDFLINMNIKIDMDNSKVIKDYFKFYIDFMENGLRYKAALDE